MPRSVASHHAATGNVVAFANELLPSTTEFLPRSNVNDFNLGHLACPVPRPHTQHRASRSSVSGWGAVSEDRDEVRFFEHMLKQGPLTADGRARGVVLAPDREEQR